MRAPVEIIRLLIKAGSNVNKSGRVHDPGFALDLNKNVSLDAILCWLHVIKATMKLFKY